MRVIKILEQVLLIIIGITICVKMCLGENVMQDLLIYFGARISFALEDKDNG